MEALSDGSVPVLTDEDIANLAPHVRAEVLRRLERAWSACEPHLSVQRNPDTGLVMRPDVRFVEAGIRICDRLALLFRLSVPSRQAAEPVLEREELAGLVKGQIEVMEQSMGS